MSVNVLTDDGLSKIAGNVDNQQIMQKFEELESLIEQTRQLRADLENYGLVKLSNARNVTDSAGLALPATEKNPEIDGTLANEIKINNDNLKSLFIYEFTVGRNTKTRFCKLMPNPSREFELYLDIYETKEYGVTGYSKLLIGKNGCTEIELSEKENMLYKKKIHLYKSDSDGHIYIYLENKNYNDYSKIIVSAVYPRSGAIFEKVDVTKTWESEIQGKTFMFDSDTYVGGLFVNGIKI